MFQAKYHSSTSHNGEYSCAARCTHGFLEKIKTRARTSFQKTFIAADFALSPAFFHSIETLLPKQYQLNPKKFKQTLFSIQVMLYSTNEITAHCVHFSVKKHTFA